MRPVFEHVMMEPSTSFVWRCDDYPWKRNVWHVHPEVEIHLIRNAAGVSFVGDFIGQFEPGHLCIVGGGLPHNWVTDIPPGEIIRGRDIVLQFDVDRLRHAACWLPEIQEVEPLLERARHGLAFHGQTRQTAAALLEAMRAAGGVERLSLFLRLLHTLAGSTQCVELSSAGFSPDLDHVTLELVQKALTYLFENVARGISLSEVADLVGMSESGFSRFFKKNSGNSFTDHITKLRIGRACDLLTNTALPVTDICYEVGYSNLSNFNRNFLRQRGCTPSSYRRLANRRTV